ncbi:MAG: uL14 family ribosomal protein, partial [Candidatus Altarchaeaceae archaeon]
DVCDNSGAKQVKCIRILGKVGRKKGTIGDFIKISVKKYRKKGKIRIKKNLLHTALIVKVKKKQYSKIGSFFMNYKKNSVLLFNNKLKPAGTRNQGFFASTLRQKKKMKLLALNLKTI